MSYPRLLMVTVLTWFALLSGAESESGSPSANTKTTDDESALATGYLEKAIAAGLPDPRGATLFVGQWREDSKSDLEPRAGFVELHLRLANGRWLMRGMHLRPSAEPAAVLAEGWHHVTAEQAQHLDEQSRYPTNERSNSLLKCSWITPGRGLRHYLRFADLVMMGRYDLVQRVAGENEGFEQVESLQVPGNPWKDVALRVAAEKQLLSPPSERIRREIFGFARDVAILNGVAEAQEGLTAAARGLLSEAEKPLLDASIARLQGLPPVHNPVVKNLAQQVQDWNGYIGFPGVFISDHEYNDGPSWAASQIDALVDLVSDVRPGRWVQGATPRTIGDAALRLLGYTWGVDPRVLVGRDPKAPWSEMERTATAEAVQKFWGRWRGKSLGSALAEDPSLLSLAWRTRLCLSIPSAQRGELGRAVAGVWSNYDQAQRDALADAAFEDALGMLGQTPELNHLMLSWPITGRLRVQLALWHELHHDVEPLTNHLRELLKKDPTQIGEQDRYATLRATMLGGTQERLGLLFSAHRDAIYSTQFRVAHGLICQARRGMRWGGESPIFDHCFDDDSNGFQPRREMLSLLIDAALWDERPLAGFRSGVRFGSFVTNRKDAEDLRVCDEVVMSQAEHFGLRESQNTFPAAGTMAERDAVLATLRANAKERMAMMQAGSGLRLPQHASVPEVIPAFPVWWQQELDAAKAEGRAIGLLFTNTKTCAPCHQLEREVLNKPEWQAWAKEHLRMVVLNGATRAKDDQEFDRRWEVLANLYITSGGIPNFNLVLPDGRLGGLHLSFEDGGPKYYITAFTAALARAMKNEPGKP